MGQNADAIAAAHEGVIAGHHLGHQAKYRRLDPRLGGRFLFRRVGHAAGAATDEDPGIVRQVQIGGQVFTVKPDAAGATGRQAAFAQEGREFLIRRLILGSQLQDQEGLARHAGIRASTIPAYQLAPKGITSSSKL